MKWVLLAVLGGILGGLLGHLGHNITTSAYWLVMGLALAIMAASHY